MKEKRLLFLYKIIFLFVINSLFSIQTSLSQCVNPVPAGSNSQSFCKTDNSTIADLVATGGTIVWYDSSTGGNQYDSSSPLINNTVYYADDITDGSCSVNRLAVTAIIYGDFPTNVDVFVGKCASDDPTIADLSVTGSNIKWFDAQTDGTLLQNTTLLTDGQSYWVEQTENGCTSDRLPTLVTIIDPPLPTVESEQTFCTSLNPTIGDLQPTESNIIWYESEASTLPLDPITPLINGQNYWAAQSSFPCESTIRAQTTVVLETPPYAGENGEYTVCGGSLVTTNLFESLSGFPDSTGTWSGPSTLSSGYLGTFDPEVNVTGIYTYTVSSTSDICPDDSSSVVVGIVNVVPPTTTEANQAFCELDSATIANLSASGNGIIWYDTETSTTPLENTDLLVNGEDYWASQTDVTSNCESATRLVVTVSIVIPPPPTTNEANQAFCELDSAIIADLDASGNGVIWYDTETSTTPLEITDLLVDGEDYWASQTDITSDCESATRLVVTVSIITPPPPTTAETNQAFCELDNATIADLDVSGNGIIWYETETSDTPLDNTDLLVNGEDYWAVQTDINSGCESAERVVVTVSIITQPPPIIAETNQAFCELDNATIADLDASGSGIIWYNTETSDTPLDNSDLLVNGEDYWAAQTDSNSGCSSTDRTVVTVSIITPPPPATAETNQAFCELDNATVADLDATESNILWYDAQTGGNLLAATDFLSDGQYWATQTDATLGCESAIRLSVNVTITTIPPPTTIETTQAFCENDNVTVADLAVTGTNIQWYDAEINGNLLALSNPLSGGQYWASQTDATSGCESASRLLVNATIMATPPPTTTDSNQAFCEVANATIADLVITGNSVLWYDTETSTTPLETTDLLVDGEDYWAIQTDATTNCESSSRLVVTASVIVPTPPTTTNANQVFCLAIHPTIDDLQADGTGILWYDTETSITALNATDSLVDGEDYWATQSDISVGCESSSRLVVTISLTDISAATITNLSQSFCASAFPTIAELQATGNNIIWYASETETTPLNASDLLENETSYWAAQSNAVTGCASSVRVAVNVNLVDPGTPEIVVQGNEFCFIDDPTISDLNAVVFATNGGTITWYDSYPNGSVISLSEFLIDGETYYAVESNSTGCSSLNPLEVTVTLDACNQYDIEIYDGFSPTGNGINDTFKIENLRELYPDFRVEFYNRWGNLVYTSSVSNPDWNGRLNGNGELVPAGVYYFIIYFNKDDRKPIQRRLYISR